jgi:hypothetical protein
MGFQIEIHYEMEVYKSKVTKNITALEAKDAMFEVLDQMNKIEIELEKGGYLLLGKDAVQKATILCLEAD